MSEANLKPDKPKKIKRTWKQRLKLTLIVLVIVVLGFRLGLNLLLPTVLRKVANAYDLDCTYSMLNLSMLGGNAQIWDLTLRPKTGGDSIVHADYVLGNLSTLDLLRGRLVVYRAEVDGVDILVDREPDGSIPLLKKILSPTPAPVAPAPVAAGNAPARPVNLQSPLRVDAVRVTHVNTKLRDRSVQPVFEANIQTTIRLSNIGSIDRPAHFEIEVLGDPVLDNLLVRGEAHNTPTSIDATLNVLVRGLHPKPAAGYLIPLGLKPVADSITLRAHLAFKANVIPNTPDVSAELTLEKISARVDSEDWAELDKLSLDVKKINAGAVELGTLLIQGASASARRTPRGGLAIAGMELIPATVTADRSAPMNRVESSPAGSGIPNIRIGLDEIRLKNLQATFLDQALTPAGELSARLEDMSIKNVVFDANQPDAKASLVGKATIPGVIRTIQLSGSATPFAKTKKLDLQVKAEGIKPDALAPYFAQLGLESELADGKFAAEINATSTGQVDGSILADAHLTNVRFTDTGELLVLNSANVSGLGFNPYTGTIKVKAIELIGPALPLKREASGSLSALGLRTRLKSASIQPGEKVASNYAPSTKPAKAAPATLPILPRVEIDKFAWKDIAIRFVDEMTPGSSALLGDAGIEAGDLLIDLNSHLNSQSPGKSGKFRAWLSAPNIIDRLSAEGTLTPGRQSVRLESTITGSGLTAAALGPYLKSLGIVPVLKEGQFSLKAGAGLELADGAWVSSLELRDIFYRDGATELAGVNGLRLKGLEIRPEQISIEQLAIDRPRMDVTRNADGTFVAGGLQWTPPTAAPQEAANASNPQKPVELRLPTAPIAATLKHFSLTEGSIGWSDNAPATPVHTRLVSTVDLSDAKIGQPDAAPANLKLTAKVEGAVDQATISGTVGVSPEAPAAKLKIVADGVRAGALAAYLPAGIDSTWKEGHFSGSIDIGAANHPSGGLTAHFSAAGIDLHDGASPPVIKVDSFKFMAGRIDPAGGTIAIDEIASAGVEADVKLASDGAIEAGGIRLTNVPKQEKTAPKSEAPTTQPSLTSTTRPVADIAELVAEARRPLPLLTIEKLDLQLKRLTVTGATGPDAAPVALADVRVSNPARIEAGGPDAENRPPARLEIVGMIDPIVGQFTVAAQFAPLAQVPTLALDVAATQIQGDGLTSIFPALKPAIDGSNLTQGTFNTHLTAGLNFARRGPRDLDLTRGFSVDVDIKPVEFRAVPDGPVLAGLEEIRSDGIQINPKIGSVIVKSVEITKPIGRIMRDEAGIHALGLLIPLQAAAPTTAPAAAPALAEGSGEKGTSIAEIPSTRPAISEPPANEIRLDRLTVTGVDLVVEDRTSTPYTLVSLNGLDVDVRDISNQMPWDGKPARFNVLVTSNKVPLPLRKGIGGNVPTTQATGEGANTEDRELFSQITAGGKVGIKQVDKGFVLDGWAKTSVNGFELLGVRGLAKPYKVTIGGGVFDDSNDIRFDPNGNIETRNKLVLTNLSLTEPPDGPIQQALKISAPIDVAIGLLTDPDGSITLNLPVPIKNGAITTGDIVGPAIGAVAGVLTTAIASAPVKAIGGVGDLLGMGGSKQAIPEQPVTIGFLPGYTAMDETNPIALVKIIERMKKDQAVELQIRHELSNGDVTRAGLRANPSLEECRVLAEQLRRKKTDLLIRRGTLAGQARGELGARPESAALPTLDRLQALDRQIAQTENSLDRLYDLLRPGAERQADRRTRSACLDIGRQRLEVVRAVFVNAGVPDADQRVHQANPQFSPTEAQTGGQVVIMLVPKKK